MNRAPLTAAALRYAEGAAATWSDKLLSDPRARAVEEHDARKIRALARAAFTLYTIEWGDFDVRYWAWPLRQLAVEAAQTYERVGRAFDGMEPWAVLLRCAVRYALA